MLTKDEQDEYTKAFGAEPQDDAPEGESGDVASSVTLNDTPTEEPETPPAEEAPAEEAPAEEAPAEEPPAEEEPETPEETQRRKSWEGRLKKMEEDLKAREAALAARETPETLADGGKVEDEEPIDVAEGEGNGTVNVEDVEKYADGGDVDSLDSIKAEAMELAKDPEKLAAAIKSMIADYGRDFVVVATAAPMVLVDSRAEEFAGKFDSALSDLAEEVKEAFDAIHRDRIEEGHEDYQDLYDPLIEWVGSMSEEEKQRAQAIIDGGMPSKIKRLYSEYKKAKEESDKPKEKTPEDIWAEDAASSIRSSSPLKLPTRAPGSDDDEYKRAFNEA